MKSRVAKFLRDEAGVTGIEYGLIAALVAVAIIVGTTMLGASVGDAFDAVAGEVDLAVVSMP